MTGDEKKTELEKLDARIREIGREIALWERDLDRYTTEVVRGHSKFPPGLIRTNASAVYGDRNSPKHEIDKLKKERERLTLRRNEITAEKEEK